MNLFIFSWTWIPIQSPFCYKALIYIIVHHSFHCEAPLKKNELLEKQASSSFSMRTRQNGFLLEVLFFDEDAEHFIYSCVLILKAWLKTEVLALIRSKHLNPKDNLNLKHYTYLLVLFWVYFCQGKLIPFGKINMRWAVLCYIMPWGWCI